MQQNFYQKLYQSDSNVSFDILGQAVKKLSPQDQIRMDEPINLAECSEALKGMSNGKTPGIDGLTAEFYKCFWGKAEKTLFCCHPERLIQKATSWICEKEV